MKIKSLISIILLGLSIQLMGQSSTSGIEGIWQGTLDAAGTKLRLVLTVKRSENGGYSATLDSLDQGATIPVDTISVKADAVSFEIKSVGAVYEGTLNKDRTELIGKFTQGGQTFPLDLKRAQPSAKSPTPTPSPSPTTKPDRSAPPDASVQLS